MLSPHETFTKATHLILFLRTEDWLSRFYAARVNLCRLRISAARLLYPGDLNRSTQHLLILLDKEVADGDVTDIVHGEAEG